MATPAVKIDLEVDGGAWGHAVIEAPPSVPQRVNDVVPLLSSDARSSTFVGELDLLADWSVQGLQLTVRSVQRLATPPTFSSRPGRLSAFAFALSIWLSPPIGSDEERVHLGKFRPQPSAKSDGVSYGAGVVSKCTSLLFDRTIGVQFPERWVLAGRESAGTVRKANASPKQAFTFVAASPSSYSSARESTSPTFGGTRSRSSPGSPVNRGRRQDLAADLRRLMLGKMPSVASAGTLKQWADEGQWYMFHPEYCRYDDWLLPISEVTAVHPDGKYRLSQEAVRELQNDTSYMRIYSHVVRLVLLSWGWDLEAMAPVDERVAGDGQGWEESGRCSWRFRQLCLSLSTFDREDLLAKVRPFVVSLGYALDLDEDGLGEAMFTLDSLERAQDFWSRRREFDFTTGKLPLRAILKMHGAFASCASDIVGVAGPQFKALGINDYAMDLRRRQIFEANSTRTTAGPSTHATQRQQDNNWKERDLQELERLLFESTYRRVQAAPSCDRHAGNKERGDREVGAATRHAAHLEHEGAGPSSFSQHAVPHETVAAFPGHAGHVGREPYVGTQASPAQSFRCDGGVPLQFPGSAAHGAGEPSAADAVGKPLRIRGQQEIQEEMEKELALVRAAAAEHRKEMEDDVAKAMADVADAQRHQDEVERYQVHKEMEKEMAKVRAVSLEFHQEMEKQLARAREDAAEMQKRTDEAKRNKDHAETEKELAQARADVAEVQKRSDDTEMYEAQLGRLRDEHREELRRARDEHGAQLQLVADELRAEREALAARSAGSDVTELAGSASTGKAVLDPPASEQADKAVKDALSAQQQRFEMELQMASREAHLAQVEAVRDAEERNSTLEVQLQAQAASFVKEKDAAAQLAMYKDEEVQRMQKELQSNMLAHQELLQSQAGAIPDLRENVLLQHAEGQLSQLEARMQAQERCHQDEERRHNLKYAELEESLQAEESKSQAQIHQASREPDKAQMLRLQQSEDNEEKLELKLRQAEGAVRNERSGAENTGEDKHAERKSVPARGSESGKAETTRKERDNAVKNVHQAQQKNMEENVGQMKGGSYTAKASPDPTICNEAEEHCPEGMVPVVSVTIENIHYDELVQHEALRKRFNARIEDAIESEGGKGIAVSSVVLKPTDHVLQADATIEVPLGTTAGRLISTLKAAQEKIRVGVEPRLRNAKGVKSVSSAGAQSINVSKVEVTYGEAPTAGFQIILVGGTKDDKCCLTSNDDGSNVYFESHANLGGRQRWIVTKGEGNWYHIEVAGGVTGIKRYLGSNDVGTSVDLHEDDDETGLQRWNLIKATKEDWYHIVVKGGILEGHRTFLSANEEADNVYLAATDDGSGRQRWVLPNWIQEEKTYRLIAYESDGKLGLQPASLPPNPVFIRSTVTGSWAEKKGITTGDELLMVDGMAVCTMDQQMLYEYMAHQRPSELVFAHNDEAKLPKLMEAAEKTKKVRQAELERRNEEKMRNHAEKKQAKKHKKKAWREEHERMLEEEHAELAREEHRFEESAAHGH